MKGPNSFEEVRPGKVLGTLLSASRRKFLEGGTLEGLKGIPRIKVRWPFWIIFGMIPDGHFLK